jgi:hypothetical protein
VLVYQEQIITLLQKVAGYTAGEADLVRKAIGKKIESLMRKEEPRFLAGCREKGLSDDQAQTLWRLIQPFAGYSFNRAHAAGYGLVAWQTAYLKAHHPGRVHGGPAHQRQGRQGRPPQVPRVLPAHGHHRPAPRRQRVRLGLHPGRRQRHPVRASARA